MNEKTGLLQEMAEDVLQKIQTSILLLRETPRRSRKLLVDLSSLRCEIEFVQAKLHEVGLAGECLENVRADLYDTIDLVDQIYFSAKARLKQQYLTCWSHTSNCISGESFSFETKEVKAMVNRFRNIKVDTQASIHLTNCDHETAKNFVVGREENKRQIVEQLQVPDDSDKLLVISISGMEGLGKTTLAQLAFHDSDVSNQFNLRLWVDVNNEFNIFSLVLKIVKKMMTNKDQKPSLVLEELYICLRKNIEGMSFLLVLDNVLAFDPEVWGTLLDLLSVGKCNCKIIVTTRSEELANQMEYAKCTVQPYKLPTLLSKDALDLFVQEAFQPGQTDIDQELINLGKKIVKKCDYVPHTIKFVASNLRDKPKHEWKDIASSSIESYLQTPSKLTEHQLPSSLKRCFAYCAIFPPDYVFNKVQLINIWIAHSFIRQPLDDKGLSLEDIGKENFMKLQNWSFFLNLKPGDLKPGEQGNDNFKMLPLSLNQARSMAGSETMVIKDSITDIPNGIYHLLFDAHSTLKLVDLIEKLPAKLRSFFMVHGSTKDLTKTNYHQLFSRLKYLRVLDLSASKMDVVPKYIGSLKNLRYLNFSKNDFMSLPNSITKLTKLQVLDLSFCVKLQKLPKHTRRLESLRHLYLEGCTRLASMPVGIGQMTSLQTLTHFVLNKGPNSCKVDELNNLNLKAELTILFACKQQLQ
ncbi:unnamed protein product [Amaranthus hypochondriacus]